jgi:NADH dehydrogenase/NADH:ubiquinone oxidoreductase subunit G
MAETVSITVDDQDVETAEGTSVLAAALEAGICIPNLCDLPNTTAIGACRVCLVEVESGGRTKMTASCTLEAREGMVIHAHSDDVLRARRNMVELLVAEAPEVAALQRLAERLGVDEVRYPERERDCILCGRCVTACAEIAAEGTLGVIGRGIHRHTGLPFYDEKYCDQCKECKERCPMEILPEGRRGEPSGVCGSELSKNDEIPEVCEDCPLD